MLHTDIHIHFICLAEHRITSKPRAPNPNFYTLFQLLNVLKKMSSTSEESNEEIRELNRLMFGLRSPSQTGKSLHSPIRSDVSLEIRKKRKRPFVKTKTELERIYGSSVNTNTQAKSSKISNRSTHRSKRLQEPVKSKKSQNVVAISASLLRKLFSKVAFSYSGNFEQHLYALLRRGGATHYTTTGPAVTHFIVCAGADDFVVKNVKLWYEDCIQFVQPDWVYECIRKEKLLGPESDNTSFDGETTIQLKEEGDRYVCRVNECDVVPNDASLQVFEESTLKDQREKPELMVFEGSWARFLVIPRHL
ncbi:unnamed protein product [Allacma fusca]|uniref:BRCT domain-containing protein n=1 Tax=Allacma fusca TaxID=39272 RepID=A0A8J2JMF3_9HEXA|nr:unnamed protein product [Allacma fusca]